MHLKVLHMYSCTNVGISHRIILEQLVVRLKQDGSIGNAIPFMASL